jgi:hypothetical protein
MIKTICLHYDTEYRCRLNTTCSAFLCPGFRFRSQTGYFHFRAYVVFFVLSMQMMRHCVILPNSLSSAINRLLIILQLDAIRYILILGARINKQGHTNDNSKITMFIR